MATSTSTKRRRSLDRWTDALGRHLPSLSRPEYTANLAHLIQDVRKDFDSPNLPFVIAQMGVGGVDGADAHVKKFKAAQAAVMDLPEAKTNVATRLTHSGSFDVEFVGQEGKPPEHGACLL